MRQGKHVGCLRQVPAAIPRVVSLAIRLNEAPERSIGTDRELTMAIYSQACGVVFDRRGITADSGHGTRQSDEAGCAGQVVIRHRHHLLQPDGMDSLRLHGGNNQQPGGEEAISKGGFQDLLFVICNL